MRKNEDKIGAIVYRGVRMEKNIPKNCRECGSDKNCLSYYGSYECQKRWKIREPLKDDSGSIDGTVNSCQER